MIDRREILDTASLVSLNAHVVEKDYVLGWMLAGIEAGKCQQKCRQKKITTNNQGLR